MAEVCLVFVHEKGCTGPRVLQRHTSPGMPGVVPVPGFTSSCTSWQKLPQPSSMAEIGPVPGCGRAWPSPRMWVMSVLSLGLMEVVNHTNCLPITDKACVGFVMIRG